MDSGDPDQVTADQVGAVAVAASAAAAVGGRQIRLRDQAEADEALALLQAAWLKDPDADAVRGF
ncbi:hypothetical protein [Streptomyces sp. F-1]|uniref:hypothetical protein n=1 Tax=Streptomyces sp. F-1 TaxID=463642 RepID=UPI00085BB085|nr:hypothetical protein [Streptomyces sp. F-1]SFY47829.1 hypothetical protein STEPF1_01041 [Streptomyces sp. F-1]